MVHPKNPKNARPKKPHPAAAAFLNFWKSENDRIAAAREIVVLMLVVLLLASSLWLYTGQPFPKAPMVVIESGSMMHYDHPYGRLGTIDPGDIVLVQAVHLQGDVRTREREKNNDGKKTYGEYGDVIIYRPMNRTDRTPIIHRARCWVEVVSTTGGVRYNVPDYGISNAQSINIPELRLDNYKPANSGFITAGDHNLEMGSGADQSGGICAQPVKVEWIIGKARGEVAWLGAFKLAISGNSGAAPEGDWIQFGRAKLPGDVCTLAMVSVVALFAAPWILDFAIGFVARKIDEGKKRKRGFF